jgi:hypothetical protein
MNGYRLDGTDNDRIREFLYDPANEYNCGVCPYAGAYGKQPNLPCGQFRCWVTMHIMNEEE